MKVLSKTNKNGTKDISQFPPLHIQTPLFFSDVLSELTQKEIYLKMECYQPISSFKLRGIGLLSQELVNQGHDHLVASSGGNAGFAVHYAAKKLGVASTIFVPTTTNRVFLDVLKHAGANIVVAGDVWDEAHNRAMEFVKKNNFAYIPPFDHPTIWHGHSTMIDEMVWQGKKPDAIIASVGGGGLMCGILEGTERNDWSDVALFSAETSGADSFAKSIEAGKLITLDKITSIATTLGAKRVTSKLFEWSKKRKITPVVMSDYEAVLACRKFLDHHRVLVEPACGAALSVIYNINKYPELMKANTITVIVCGGIGLSYDLMKEYLQLLK